MIENPFHSLRTQPALNYIRVCGTLLYGSVEGCRIVGGSVSFSAICRAVCCLLRFVKRLQLNMCALNDVGWFGFSD